MMKTARKYLRFTSLIFAILILMQSCVAYKAGTFTLEEAARTEHKVKLKTTDNKILKYKKVEFANGGFYGIKRTKDLTRVSIDENNIESVMLEDKSLSTIFTIATPIVVIGAIVGIRSLIVDSISIGY